MDASNLANPDKHSLAEIFDLDDEDDVDLLKELFDQLKDDAPDYFKELSAAKQASDLEAIARLAHSMKSSFGNLGFVAVSSLCNSIMMHAREGRNQEAADETALLEEASQQILEAIETLASSL